jgi:hypothetical protein
MEGDIVNRVANSALVTFDLEDFYPEGKRIALDISPWLFEGVILREKEFRSQVKNLPLSEFKDAYVALHCTTEAIIPGWAYMLVSLQLAGTAKKSNCWNFKRFRNPSFFRNNCAHGSYFI